MKKQKILYGLFFVALWMFSSCADDKIGGGDVESGDEVTLRIPFTRGGANLEDKIGHGRIVIFSTNGQLLINKHLEGDDLTFEEEVSIGYIHLYLVANEFDSWELDNITTKEELKNKVLTYDNYPVVDEAHLVPMFGEYEWLYVDRSGLTTMNDVLVNLADPLAGGTIKRLYSKVVVKLNCDYADLPDNTAISLDGISITNMAAESCLAPVSYSGDNFCDGVMVPSELGVNYFLKEATPGVVTGFTAELALLVPEYMINDVSKPTIVKVHACQTDSPSVKFIYKLVLGNGIAKGNAHMSGSSVTREDLTITRNTLYTFDIQQVLGFGEGDPLQIITEVEEWNPVTIDGDLGGSSRLLNISQVKTEISELCTRRIYFWSSQRNVSLEATCQVSGNVSGSYGLDNYFVGLTGDTPANFHYTWDNGTRLGSGYIDLVPKNITSGDYTFVLTLNANELKRNITVSAHVPKSWKERPWVCTFHRKNQVGERVIYAGHTGNWKATVEYPSGTSGFVLLSGGSTTDFGIKTNDADDAELHPIIGGSSTVSGTGNIFFRVGMSSTTTSNRYARIKLEWKDGVADQISYIYVRQGETPAAVGGTLVWQAYNTQWASSLVEYPTQSGMFYQWGGESIIYPIDPISGVWDSTGETSIQYTACPEGYTYPMRGSTWDFNSVFTIRNGGYCADGYFDRLELDETIGSVKGDTHKVGYRGIVVGDLSTYATMFMPASGRRNNTDGALVQRGETGYYWALPNTYFFRPSKAFSFGVVGAISVSELPWDLNTAYGQSIRCVKK